MDTLRLLGYVCLGCNLTMDPPRLLGYVCLGCNVTTDVFWHILMRLNFWAY